MQQQRFRSKSFGFSFEKGNSDFEISLINLVFLRDSETIRLFLEKKKEMVICCIGNPKESLRISVPANKSGLNDVQMYV